MMSRIQELADQAKESVPKGILTPDLWIQEYNRIFAKLIVDDCVTIIYEQERVPKEFFYAKPAHQHDIAIKRHFGLDGENSHN